MLAVENDPVKFVPITGPAVDALENRKETNNHPKISAQELQNSFEKVKTSLFDGLSTLLQKA